jgi:2-C-methyl-D-erythritol 4-phosphate cytidylyltransferase
LTFDSCGLIDEIFLVVPEPDRDQCRDVVVTPSQAATPVHLVSGGPNRQASVFAGLEATRGKFELVAIHDGVRPFVTTEMITACIEQASQGGACMVAQEISDTVKRANRKGHVVSTVDRTSLRLAQTPQAFRYKLIWEAHTAAVRNGYRATDDVELVERLGRTIITVPGSRKNIKVTTREDLEIARALWAERLTRSEIGSSPTRS